MITVKALKALAGALKRTEPPRVSVTGDVVQVWSRSAGSPPGVDKEITGPVFVLELPRDEVTGDAIEKYGSEPVNTEWLLAQAGYEPPYEQTAWRDVIVPKDRGVPAMASRISVDDEGDEVELVKLTGTGDEGERSAHVQAPIYDFFVEQLLAPKFELAAPAKWSKYPSFVVVREDGAVVGTIAPYDVSD